MRGTLRRERSADVAEGVRDRAAVPGQRLVAPRFGGRGGEAEPAGVEDRLGEAEGELEDARPGQ